MAFAYNSRCQKLILAVTFCDVSTEASKEKRSFICYTGKVPVCMSCSAEFFFAYTHNKSKLLMRGWRPLLCVGSAHV